MASYPEAKFTQPSPPPPSSTDPKKSAIADPSTAPQSEIPPGYPTPDIHDHSPRSSEHSYVDPETGERSVAQGSQDRGFAPSKGFKNRVKHFLKSEVKRMLFGKPRRHGHHGQWHGHHGHHGGHGRPHGRPHGHHHGEYGGYGRPPRPHHGHHGGYGGGYGHPPPGYGPPPPPGYY